MVAYAHRVRIKSFHDSAIAHLQKISHSVPVCNEMPPSGLGATKESEPQNQTDIENASSLLATSQSETGDYFSILIYINDIFHAS